jgi:hypothetical protein
VGRSERLQVVDLIARKLAGPEQSVLAEADLPFHEREYVRLTRELAEAAAASALPEAPSARPALNDLLVRLRLGSLAPQEHEHERAAKAP